MRNRLLDLDLIDNLSKTNTIQNLDTLSSEKVHLEFEKSTNKIPLNLYGQDFGVKFSQRQWKKLLDTKLEDIAKEKRRLELKKLQKRGVGKGNNNSMVLYSERKMFMKFNEGSNKKGWITYGYRRGEGENFQGGVANDSQKDEKIVFNRVEN